MPDEQPSRALAVLLGASTFPNAPKLAEGRAFYISAADVKEYLCDQAGLALPRRNVLSLFDDSRSPSDQLVEVAGFLTRRSLELKAEGTRVGDLFIYYVGHGLFTRGDQAYCLAIRSTNEINEGATSIRASDLAGVIKENAAFLRRYLIFDCCFAASIHKEFQSGPLTAARVQLAEEFPERGTALLCSSNAHEPSLAPRGLEHTMFSNALLQALRNGREGIGARLSFSELGDLIKENLRTAYPDSWVRPEVHSPDQREGDIASIPIFPNPAFHESDAIAEQIARRRKAEEDRIEEQKRLAREKAEEAEQRRVAMEQAEKAEAERFAREKVEADKAAQEKLLQQKADAEKAEAEERAKFEEAKAARFREMQRAEMARRAEAERAAAERAENERAEEELAKKERAREEKAAQQKADAERKAAEAARARAQQAEWERSQAKQPASHSKQIEQANKASSFRDNPAVKILGGFLIFAVLVGGGLWLSHSPDKKPQTGNATTTASPSQAPATQDEVKPSSAVPASNNPVNAPVTNGSKELANAPPKYPNPAAIAFNLSSRYAIAGPDDAQTVLDTKTGLMWMRKDYRNIEGRFSNNWNDAMAWPSKINAESYGGYSDWKVPTIAQYRTINTSKSDRMLYTEIFAKTEGEDYWSSNTPGQYTASYMGFKLTDGGGYAVSGDRKMPDQYSDGSQMRMSIRLVRAK
jgi:hypothetical protein